MKPIRMFHFYQAVGVVALFAGGAAAERGDLFNICLFVGLGIFWLLAYENERD